MKFKLKYKTMMDYWHGKPFETVEIVADNELEAECLFVDKIFPLMGFDPSMLAGQLYTLTAIDEIFEESLSEEV